MLNYQILYGNSRFLHQVSFPRTHLDDDFVGATDWNEDGRLKTSRKAFLRNLRVLVLSLHVEALRHLWRLRSEVSLK